MTQQLGVDVAQFVGDMHEFLALSQLGWIVDGDATGMTTKVNQPTLMDLQNNAVGRDLVTHPHFSSFFSSVSPRELFNHAKNNNMLILNAGNAYQYFGIRDGGFINEPTWTVNVQWAIGSNRAQVLHPTGESTEISFGIRR
jgi:hypothetical protein